MPFVQPSQFIGKYALTRSFNDGDAKIIQIRNEVEFKYLVALFGVELYEKFMDEFADEPKYTKLVSPFAFQNRCEAVTTRGITEMLIGLTYCHYVQEMPGIATSVGKTQPNPEAGTLANDLNIISFYNDSIADYRKIQEYIMLNRDLYPEFKGNYKTFNYWF